MVFEWDDAKNIYNKQKHRISFETAIHVFDDPDYIEMYDFEHRYLPVLRQRLKGGCIMIERVVIEEGQKATEEQLAEVREAAKHPIIFDEDCEELSPAMMKAFRSAVAQRNRGTKKKA